MTMRERMMQGKLFTDDCEGLPQERIEAKRRMKALNDLDPADLEGRKALLNKIFGKETDVWIETPSGQSADAGIPVHRSGENRR